jgi:hypothetical protein
MWRLLFGRGLYTNALWFTHTNLIPRLGSWHTKQKSGNEVSCPKIGLHKHNVNVYTTRHRSKDFL